jgi:hypothetical protein
MRTFRLTKTTKPRFKLEMATITKGSMLILNTLHPMQMIEQLASSTKMTLAGKLMYANSRSITQITDRTARCRKLKPLPRQSLTLNKRRPRVNCLDKREALTSRLPLPRPKNGQRHTKVRMTSQTS